MTMDSDMMMMMVDFNHRTRERCDDLAAQGFMVILPDYFRGVVPEECGPGDFACWAGAMGTNNLGS